MRRLTRILVMMSLLLTCGSPVGATQYSEAERVLASMREAMRQPEQVVFTQDVNMSAILSRWRFSATVTRSGDVVSVSAKGAPSFIPPDLLADLADFEKALTNFDLEYLGKEQLDGRTCHVLKGVRRPQFYTGAVEGRIWIDEHEHLMRRTEARYSWGRVRVNHTYMSMDDFTVLAQQEASISPFAVRLTITYRDYRLND
ncbi:MAG: hypothetical protein ACOYEP_02005 [Limnochordia bacterium]|jgi:hypothetical protein